MKTSGPLLRRSPIQHYRALGESGRSVFSAAAQMRSTLRRKLGQEAADVLAIPQVGEAGEDVDWYAPFGGTVVPWSAATPDEQAGALERLRQVRDEFARYSGNELAEGASGDREVFARMLPLAGQIPDDSHIYLVDGRPVLTFWGFQPQNALPGHDVLRDLRMTPPPVAPAIAEPAAEAVLPPPPAPRPLPWWRRWWWLLALLLLLLLALLLFGLRGCETPVTGLDVPTVPATETPAPQPDQPVTVVPRDRGVLGGWWGRVFGGGAAVPVPGDSTTPVPGDSTTPVPGGVDKPGEAPADGAAPPAPDAGQGQDTPADQPKDQDQTPPQPPVPDQPPAPDQAATPLALPPEAGKSADTDFMNGRWKSRTGLVDGNTGRPLDMEYAFDGGKGTATIRRSDGVKCTAPAQTRMSGGKLVIDQGQADCPDGTSFRGSKVECVPGADGRAACKGTNAGSGSGYHVQITR